MSCKLHLGKQIFDSEQALDEYILNNEVLLEGDLVFSEELTDYKTIQNLTRKVLLEVNKESDRLKKEGKLIRESTVTAFSEDHYKVKEPYVGVNTFLKLYKFKDSLDKEHPLSPVFNMDSFIQEKAKDWKSDEYWKTKAPDEEIRDIFGDGEPHPITTLSELNTIKEMYTKKWEHQSYLGTAVHGAMSEWWKARAKDKKDPATFTKYLKNKLENKYVGSSTTIKYKEIIPEHIWEQISEHCFNIEQELRNKFGKHAMFLSEIGLISNAVNALGKEIKLLGVADLIVIDEEGNILVLDYKTSPKVYGNYNSAKKRSFHYQLAVYRRMIQRMGLNVDSKSGVYVIPMQFLNFHYDLNTDTSTFDNLISEAYDPSEGSNSRSYLEELPILAGDEAEVIRYHLDSFIPIIRTKDTRADDLVQKLDDFTREHFPSYSDMWDLTDEKIIDKIKRLNNFKKDENTGKFKFKIGNKIIYKSTEAELIEEVKSVLQGAQNRAFDITQGVKHLIREAQKTGILNFNVGKIVPLSEFTSAQWIENQLSRYATKDWNILEGPPILELLGFILLENVYTKQVNVIKISNTSWLSIDDPVLLGGKDSSKEEAKKNTRRTLTGNFESDITLKLRPQSLVMDSTYGNIELMQTMAVIDLLPRFFSNNGRVVGDILVMNTLHLQIATTSNKQLLYNYNELRRLSSKDLYSSNFKEKNIKCLTFTESVATQFREIMNVLNSNEMLLKYSKWKDFKDCANDLDNYAANPIKLRAKLIDLANKLEDKFNLGTVETVQFSELTNPEKRLYYTIHMAIAEIDGVDFVLQTKDHDLWMEHSHILSKGLSGTLFDNPGNMSSDTLNSVSKLVYVAYLNVRNDVLKLNSELRNKINALKKSKNFSWIEARTIGNLTDLYKNLYDLSVTDDLMFKNPWDPEIAKTLSREEIDLLKFVLYSINGDRFNLSTEEEFTEHRMTKPEAFFSVPLTVGSFASLVSMKGMMQTLKDKFKGILPANIAQTVKEKFEGYLLETDEVKKARTGEMWKMMNSFDASNDLNTRQKVINQTLENHGDLGLNYFEHNIEILCLKHKYAFSLQEHLNKVFPTIKAAMLHLSMSGIIMNDKFEHDILYLRDFIKSKIFNLSIQDEKWENISYVINKIMSGASKMALAFNPRLLYQALDGIWKDISLVIRKPDGDTSFTSDNMKDAFFWIYKDMMHFGDNKSLAELLNEQYGLNDMDMNSLVEKISSDNVGIWNFWNIAFKFASRPDFYNRLTIFGALMRGDGCFEAHSVKDGKLIYDWKKDKRFDLLAQGNDARSKDPKKYDLQKALYLAMAKQFIAEHATNEDGTLFTLDLDNLKPLPRAYTTKQSESMKSLSDLIYGYYSHEKKALIQSTTLGALFMQMNTYWSSKKNQWLAPGGVKQMGKMELYEEVDYNTIDPETGKPKVTKYWVLLDSEGNPTNIPTKENTGIPYMQWKGLYLEGIIVTLANMYQTWKAGDINNEEKSFVGVINDYWNHEDENLRRAYRNNLSLLLYDLFMLLFLGMLVTPALLEATKTHIKETGNNTFTDALLNNCTYNLVSMLDSSADDFNVFHSLFGKGVLWTPFAIGNATRTFDNISRMITGDRDLYDATINLTSATKSQEPIWDFVKISTLGREIGDNGEE